MVLHRTLFVTLNTYLSFEIGVDETNTFSIYVILGSLTGQSRRPNFFSRNSVNATNKELHKKNTRFVKTFTEITARYCTLPRRSASVPKWRHKAEDRSWRLNVLLWSEMTNALKLKSAKLPIFGEARGRLFPLRCVRLLKLISVLFLTFVISICINFS